MSNNSPSMLKVGVVVIGRNEGSRLLACFDSISIDKDRVVYVDSGSTDQSVKEAERRGVRVVTLDMSVPFTAARARNSGWTTLVQLHPDVELIQFIDGDCELDADWLNVATDFLSGAPQYAVACGRRREKHPENSVYNRLCDIEWDTPVGDSSACGGDALIRTIALQDVNGFNGSLIAGEEPELCVRLRQRGYKIRRLDHEMTRHDAAMLEFSQWWQRSLRAGFAYALGAEMHGASPEFHWVKETRRALFWGLLLPVALIGMSIFFQASAAFLAIIYPAQVIRLWLRSKDWGFSFFTTIGKFPEAQGILKYKINKKSGLIEYKKDL